VKETLTQPPESREEMENVQRKVAEVAAFEDDFCGVEAADFVAGVDQAFAQHGDVAVSAAVVVRTEDGETVETATARRETRVPYISGLLAFREGEAVVASLEKLEDVPDIVLVDGSGRIHPRQAGLATHVGVALGIPTVGVAKSLLCGTPSRSIERLEEGDRVEIVAEDRVNAPDGTTIGYAVQTKQYSKGASTSVNPLYVSPGHLVSAETATDLVAEACGGYKLPEPVRRADKLADKKKS
jgi:deoxyribonuclease V